MPRGYQALEINGEEVLAAMHSASSIEEFLRYQSIHLRVNMGMSVDLISKVTGMAESTIHNLHSRMRREGLKAAATKGRGGRYRSYLSVDEERALLKEIEPEASRGGVIEVSKVRRAMEEKVGGTISKNTAYRLLHRHGWRKIAPRPKHPKGDVAAQETFKKTGARSLKKPGKKPKK